MSVNEINQTLKRYYSGLIGIATTGSYPENEYNQDRAYILANTKLNKLIPADITKHYTAQNFRVAMQDSSLKYLKETD